MAPPEETSRGLNHSINAAVRGIIAVSLLLAGQASADSLTPTTVPNLFVNEEISQKDIDALMLDLLLPETQASDKANNKAILQLRFAEDSKTTITNADRQRIEQTASEFAEYNKTLEETCEFTPRVIIDAATCKDVWDARDHCVPMRGGFFQELRSACNGGSARIIKGWLKKVKTIHFHVLGKNIQTPYDLKLDAKTGTLHVSTKGHGAASKTSNDVQAWIMKQ